MSGYPCSGQDERDGLYPRPFCCRCARSAPAVVGGTPLLVRATGMPSTPARSCCFSPGPGEVAAGGMVGGFASCNRHAQSGFQEECYMVSFSSSFLLARAREEGGPGIDSQPCPAPPSPPWDWPALALLRPVRLVSRVPRAGNTRRGEEEEEEEVRSPWTYPCAGMDGCEEASITDWGYPHATIVPRHACYPCLCIHLFFGGSDIIYRRLR